MLGLAYSIESGFIRAQSANSAREVQLLWVTIKGTRYSNNQVGYLLKVVRGLMLQLPSDHFPMVAGSRLVWRFMAWSCGMGRTELVRARIKSVLGTWQDTIMLQGVR